MLLVLYFFFLFEIILLDINTTRIVVAFRGGFFFTFAQIIFSVHVMLITKQDIYGSFFFLQRKMFVLCISIVTQSKICHSLEIFSLIVLGIEHEQK